MTERAERDGAADEPTPSKDRRARRRASLPAPAGSDPTPLDPPVAPRADDENDDRLRADRPPHWG